MKCLVILTEAQLSVPSTDLTNPKDDDNDNDDDRNNAQGESCIVDLCIDEENQESEDSDLLVLCQNGNVYRRQIAKTRTSAASSPSSGLQHYLVQNLNHGLAVLHDEDDEDDEEEENNQQEPTTELLSAPQDEEEVPLDIAPPSYCDWFFLQHGVGLCHSGAMVYLDTNSSLESPTVECIGEFDPQSTTIHTACWSPDAELLALVLLHHHDHEEEEGEEEGGDENNAQHSRSTAQLVIMTSASLDYQMLYEIDLDFCITNDSVQADNDIVITWKPDGSMLGISGLVPSQSSATSPSSFQRWVYLFHRDSLPDLHAKSLSEDGSGKPLRHLQPHLSWGRHYLATSSCQLSGKKRKPHSVVFLEPNGLKHGEFTLFAGPQGEKKDQHPPLLNHIIHAPSVGMGASTTTTGQHQQQVPTTSLQYYNSPSPNHEYMAIVFDSAIQLWSVSNFHWTCQQELSFGANKVKVVKFLSHDTLAVALSNNTISVLTFGWDVSLLWHVVITPGTQQQEGKEGKETTERLEITTNSTGADLVGTTNASKINLQATTSTLALFVHGPTLHYTPLDRALVPPPMSFGTMDFHACIQHVSPCSNNNLLLVLLSNRDWVIVQCKTTPYNSKGGRGRPPNICLEQVCCIQGGTQTRQHDGFFRHATVVQQLGFFSIDESGENAKERMLHVVASQLQSWVLLEINLDQKSTQILKRHTLQPEIDDANRNDGNLSHHLDILRIVPWSDSNINSDGGALLTCTNGSVWEYMVKTGSVVPIANVESPFLPYFLEPCPWIMGLQNVPKSNSTRVDDDDKNDSSQDEEQKRIIVGLSHQNRLFCGGDHMLMDCVTSIILQYPFLHCISTTDKTVLGGGGGYCMLYSFSVQGLLDWDPLAGADVAQQQQIGYEPRRVERGAKLVAVMTGNLQQYHHINAHSGRQSTMAVLQLPRGNLEGIYPRALVLPHVMRLICHHHYSNNDSPPRYGKAFAIMRRQKVDLNLLVDFDPHSFLQQDGLIQLIEQLPKVDDLNLFISSLQNFDVTESLYPIPQWLRQDLNLPRTSQQPLWDAATINNDASLTKVNQLCRAIRKALLEAQERGSTLGGRPIKDGFYLLPILSTFAKETPPKLEQALDMICHAARTILANSTSLSAKSILFSDSAQSWIRYLAFLADYQVLFETALGMYNYDLARAVARNSQMDPKVYLPLLKRLRALPVFYAKYEVDVQLKRHDKALDNLYQSGMVHAEKLNELASSSVSESKITNNLDIPFGNGFEHCMTFIEKHGLHSQALRLFEHYGSTVNDQAEQQDYTMQIMKSLGLRLLDVDKKPQAALSILLSCGDTESAIRAARASGNWRQYFGLVLQKQQQPKNDGETAIGTGYNDETQQMLMSRLAHEIAEEIVSSSSGSRRLALGDAARILLDYGKDIVQSVEKYCEADMWKEGRRLAIDHNRMDLAKKCTDSAIQYAHSTISDMENRGSSFETAMTRYVEVLEIRKKAQEDQFGADGGAFMGEEDGDTGSMFSVGSNASSIRSTASYASVKSTASTGSISSTVSSVLSISNKSSFSMSTEYGNTNRHKSKFNQIGGDKKKKKKKTKRKTGRKKMVPGSEEELKSLVSTLKANCLDEEYADVNSEACLFLSQVGQIALSQDLYNAHLSFAEHIAKCQQRRRDQQEALRLAAQQQQKATGFYFSDESVALPCEKEVNDLVCSKLSPVLDDIFSHLPGHSS